MPEQNDDWMSAIDAVEGQDSREAENIFNSLNVPVVECVHGETSRRFPVLTVTRIQ
jgi:hypothetical protein